MGIALADEAAARGAEVTLILGPSFYRPQHPGVKTIAVQTADEMYEAALSHFPGSDVAILSAAVADYRPQDTANQKLKKIADTLPIQLVKNPDIAAELGRQLSAGLGREPARAQAARLVDDLRPFIRAYYRDLGLKKGD